MPKHVHRKVRDWNKWRCCWICLDCKAKGCNIPTVEIGNA